MVKAIGLGATAVMAGRPFAYALATGGEPAVSKAFKILHDEFKGAMGFVGKTRVSEIDESVFAQCNRITDYV
ncbi:L-lactate dehydrogenase [cytochrome] [compost metagenome]